MSVISILSDNITVIPAARKIDDISRLSSEETFTRIMKNMTPASGTLGSGSFIIGYNTETADYIEFCLEGYYIKLPWSSFTNFTNVYAKCSYAVTSSEINELQGDEISAGKRYYIGITFTSEAPSTLPYMQIKNNGLPNEDALLSKIWAEQFLSDYQPYVISSTEPQESLRKKIWVSTEKEGYYFIKIYDPDASTPGWKTIASVAV